MNPRPRLLGERAMNSFAATFKSIWRPLATAAILTALVAASQPVAQAQAKSTSVSKVERLNRAPVNKEILRVQLPRPTIAKLPNGLTVLLLEDHKLPTVAFTMWIRPGQLGDPADLPGLASFTADMLREGTARRTSKQIANEVDSLGATLNASSRFGVELHLDERFGAHQRRAEDSRSDERRRAASDVFSQTNSAKYKQREEASLEHRLSNPGFLGQQALRQVLYGEAPLGVASATKESIEKVTAGRPEEIPRQALRPGNAIFGVTGDFKTEDMRALIEKYFGAWSGRRGARPAPSKAWRRRPAKITLVDRPDSVQTYIIAGDREIRRDRSGLLRAGSDEPGPRRRDRSRGSSSIFAKSTAIPMAPIAVSTRNLSGRLADARPCARR